MSIALLLSLPCSLASLAAYRPQTNLRVAALRLPGHCRSYEMHDHLQHKLVDPDRLVAIAEKSLRA